MRPINESLKVFETLFPDLREGKFLVRERNLSDFPIWLRGAVEVYTLVLDRTQGEQQEITLIRPKVELAFDQIWNVYRQVSARTGPQTLLIADDISPKYRPLLVKFRVPFVYRNESIFAPELALRFSHLRSYETPPRMESVPVRDELHPFAVKLLAAYLSGQLPNQIRLQLLEQTLTKTGISISLSKLSGVMNQLASFGFAEIVGAGPHKAFHLLGDPKEMWRALAAVPMSPLMRVVHEHYLPPSEEDYVLAGESALAEYSNLASSSVLTIATTPSVYRLMQENGVPYGDFGKPTVHLQVWKEDPRLFSVEHKINPIELYLSMKSHPDERVQQGLESMLLELGLSPMENG